MADLGNVGKIKVSPQHVTPNGTAVGTNGDATRAKIGISIRRAWNWYSSPTQNRGNTFTVPSSRLIALLLNGRYVEAAQGASGAVFFDMQDGLFYAHEYDGSGMWRVVITNGVPTVTQMSQGYGVGAGQRPIVLANGKERVLAPGDFLLGVAMNCPALLNTGALQQMKLASSSTLPLLLNNGTTTTLQVTLNG